MPLKQPEIMRQRYASIGCRCRCYFRHKCGAPQRFHRSFQAPPSIIQSSRQGRQPRALWILRQIRHERSLPPPRHPSLRTHRHPESRPGVVPVASSGVTTPESEASVQPPLPLTRPPAQSRICFAPLRASSPPSDGQTHPQRHENLQVEYGVEKQASRILLSRRFHSSPAILQRLEEQLAVAIHLSAHHICYAVGHCTFRRYPPSSN